MTVRRGIFVVSLGIIAWGIGSVRSHAEEQTAFPPQARARYDQGRELQAQGKYLDAIRAYEEAIRLGMKEYPRVHLNRARANLERENYDAAIAQFTAFLGKFSLEDSCRY